MAVGITRPDRNQREMRVHSGQQLRGGGSRAAVVSYFEQVRIRLLFGESLLRPSFRIAFQMVAQT